LLVFEVCGAAMQASAAHGYFGVKGSETQALAIIKDFCFIRPTSQPIEEFKIAWPV